jgi:hypothetical protein
MQFHHSSCGIVRASVETDRSMSTRVIYNTCHAAYLSCGTCLNSLATNNIVQVHCQTHSNLSSWGGGLAASIGGDLGRVASCGAPLGPLKALLRVGSGRRRQKIVHRHQCIPDWQWLHFAYCPSAVSPGEVSICPTIRPALRWMHGHCTSACL